MTERPKETTGEGDARHEVPDNPFDGLVNAMVAQARAQAGANTPLAFRMEGGEFTAQLGLPEPDEYQRPIAYRAHEIKSTDSFIRYCQRYGVSGRSLIFFDVGGFTLIIDEQHDANATEKRPRGQREEIFYQLVEHEDYAAWKEILKKGYMNHRQLAEFLINQEHNLLEPEICAALSSVNYNVKLNHESTIRNEGASVAVSLTSDSGDATATFPKSFRISLPVLQEDTEDTWSGDVRLVVKQPERADEKLQFKLLSPAFKLALRERATAEAEKVNEAVAGNFEIIHGTPEYIDWTPDDRRPHDDE